MLTCGVPEPFPSRHGGGAGRGAPRPKGTAEVAPSTPPSYPPAAPQHPEDPLMTHTWPGPSASSWSPGLSLSLLIRTACDSSPWSRVALDVVGLGSSFHVAGERRLLMRSGGPGLSRSLLLIFLLLTSSGHLKLAAGSSSVQYRPAPTGPSPALSSFQGGAGEAGTAEL